MSTAIIAQRPNRHWFTTTWLILALIVNAAFALIVLNPTITIARISYSRYALSLLCAGAAVGDIALLLWKKWGFFLVVCCSILNIVALVIFGNLNLIVGSIVGAVVGLAILYAVLQINKVWQYLS